MAGFRALFIALKRALHEVNPSHPLVSPYEADANKLRESLFDEAYDKAMADPNFEPSDTPPPSKPSAPGNIFRNETPEQKAAREEHEEYVNGLREQYELELAKTKAKSATALAAAQRKLDEFQGDQVKLLAEVNGRGALLGALSNALAEENPDNPLVSPVLCEKITSDARKETLIHFGADPEMEF